MFKAEKRDNFIIVVLSLLLLLYVVLRAYFLNLTHDEAHSYNSVLNFWHVQFLCTGNSHWINSLAMKCVVSLGLESPLALRWLSIISLAIILFLAFRWIKTLESGILKFSAFAFLFLDPYFIDYFSLARGYASAIALQCLCLYYFLNGMKKHNKNHLTLSLIFAAMSSIANFGFIYFFIAFSAIYFFMVYFKDRFHFWREKHFYVDSILSLFFLGIILRAFKFLVECSNDLVGAGEFTIAEMFRVFVDGQAYHKINFHYTDIQFYGLVFLFCLVAVCFYGIIVNKRQKSALYFYSSLIILIVISITTFNNVCFNVVFPYYRTTLFLFVPTSVVFFSFFDLLIKNLLIKKIVLSIIALFLLVNFCLSMNLKFCFDFKEQADCNEAYACVQNDGAQKVGISPEVFGVFYNYYSRCKNYHYIFNFEMIETRFPVGMCNVPDKLKEYDHLILYPPYNFSYYRNSKVNLQVINYFPTTGLVVARVLK
jgi:hypothetical protein